MTQTETLELLVTTFHYRVANPELDGFVIHVTVENYAVPIFLIKMSSCFCTIILVSKTDDFVWIAFQRYIQLLVVQRH